MDVSKFETRLLMDDINETMPRELRDMIYQFCWKDKLAKYNDSLHKRPWRVHDMKEEELVGNEDASDSDCWEPPHPHAEAYKPLPKYHFVDRAIVGFQIAREVAECFYRITPAYVETLEYRQLDRYFAFDNFSVGIVPRSLIPSIIFFLDTCQERYVISHGSRLGRSLTTKFTKHALEAMLGYAPKREDIPPVTFLLRYHTPPMAMKTLQWSRILHDQLKAMGANITITYQHEGFSSEQNVGPINLGAIMDLPESQWNHHFRKEILKQAPSNYQWVSKCITNYKG